MRRFAIGKALFAIAGLVAISSGASAASSSAEEKVFRPSFDACLAASGGVTAAMNDCIGAEHDYQDTRLNAAYQRLRKSMTDAERVALRDEERAWIALRDKQCAPDKDGGTAAMLDSNQCHLRETAARAAVLEKRTLDKGVAGAGTAQTANNRTALVGEWGYRTDCNLGHDVEVTIHEGSPAFEGTWSDGTRTTGSQGRLQGAWHDGTLAVRFCTDDDERGGYPACPAYSEVAAYMTAEGGKLAWYRANGAARGKGEQYVVLDRKPKGGDVPKVTKCKGGA